MTRDDIKGLIREVLKEELLREVDEPVYEYSFFFAGSRLEEDKFKQKLILTLKGLNYISTLSAVPEAVDVIVSGLKKGAELKGFSMFTMGDKVLTVKAKRAAAAEQPI